MKRQLLALLEKSARSFLRSPGRETRGAPHVRDAINLRRIMLVFVVALIPALFMAIWNTGYQANLAMARIDLAEAPGWRGRVLSGLGYDADDLWANLAHGALYFVPVYLVTLFVGRAWELLFASVRRRPLNEGLWVTGLLFALSLPPLIPLWQVALGISFGIVIAQELFGGYGRHILHPALVGRAFLYFAYANDMSGDRIWVAVDGYSRATPLSALQATAPEIGMDVIEPSWTEAFLGTIGGSMGETSTLACLIGAVVLILTGIGSWRIMLSASAGAASAAALLVRGGSETNAMFVLPPEWHLVLGGFAFGVVFFATDPVTSAQTNPGRWIYGFLVGALAVLLRVTNPTYPEGTMMAILLASVFAPLIDWFVEQRNIERRARHG
ncbi:MAG TPA: NADH:ubiquinone reductase (Na(+)-transporting) subunit B [Vicinamibacteria bacterium]|nr:NADH:ubiquinone reductase (Na(+)-transporting) subunit B [Vicinamibacteria bacterium]